MKTGILKYIENFTTKNWMFSDKKSDNFHISAQNIDCGYSLEPPRWGGSNEYPQSTLLSRNKKNNVYPWKLQFYNIKVGFKGIKIVLACFRDVEKSTTFEFITKTCLHNADPLKPHFYIAKLGFIGVNIIFLISAQKHRLWVLIRTASHNLCF